ncbi:MAG TPA: hypothetical protein VGL38_14485 [bacterium]|jgi:uncharacterized protein YceK
MKPLLLALALGVFLSGCSLHSVITPQSPAQHYAAINTAARQYPVEVSSAAGSVHHGYAVTLASDSIRWKLHEPDLMEDLRASGIHVTPQPRQALALWDVREVRITDGNRGMRDGLLFGLLSGAALGGLVQLTGANYLPAEHFIEPLIAQWALELVGGSCTGAVIGSIIGSPHIIRIEAAASPSTLR